MLNFSTPRAMRRFSVLVRGTPLVLCLGKNHASQSIRDIWDAPSTISGNLEIRIKLSELPKEGSGIGDFQFGHSPLTENSTILKLPD